MHTIENTLFIGKVFQHFSHLKSTNQCALDLLSKSSPPEGTVISTYQQLQGRGQAGSQWESDADKNITLSVILYPNFLLAREPFELNLAVSLGLFDLLDQYVDQGLKIKWPNDIYIHDRKIAGILIQNTITAQRLVSSVVGIGININQQEFSSDLSKPTSLKLATKQNYELDEIVRQLCQCLEVRYLQLKNNQKSFLREEYLNRLYRFMEDHLYEDLEGDGGNEGDIFSGRITGLSPTGELKISHDKGETAFNLKQIRFI